uniref:Uncharacterized protein n=1 Tax=Hyaloperonospora arabidopsidis (strain Emoy2) TaxID=559515 RepID=M4BGF6_HYAAE
MPLLSRMRRKTMTWRSKECRRDHLEQHFCVTTTSIPLRPRWRWVQLHANIAMDESDQMQIYFSKSMEKSLHGQHRRLPRTAQIGRPHHHNVFGVFMPDTDM